MNKKYTIEVPLYSRTVESLAKINSAGAIEITVFGGIPNSPFNGGRMNSALDGLMLWDRKTISLSSKQMEGVTAKFYETVTKINKMGMSFWAVCTNMFVNQEELTQENLLPIQWLVESYQKHGIKNGIIINNALFEEHLRQQFGDNLLYIASCTKYVSPQKLLSPKDTSLMYLEDIKKYDYVVLTPQDSRRERIIKNMVKESQHKIIVISNSYCSNACNTYHHYEYMSRQNKISLLKKSINWHTITASIKFLPHTLKCSVYWHAFFPVEVERIARMQLNAGVVHFKLGRGLGVESFEKLVALILKFKDNQVGVKQ